MHSGVGQLVGVDGGQLGRWVVVVMVGQKGLSGSIARIEGRRLERALVRNGEGGRGKGEGTYVRRRLKVVRRCGGAILEMCILEAVDTNIQSLIPDPS